jgi:alkanesulfonate monooxygenase SsuD/methylene tetrahydromethanopterin reductase-like flavin-dependent oxidoreductase (luciferase family)
VLFQAGSSGRGQQFCAANAEATFTLAPSTEVAAKYTAAVREQAVAAGRHPDDVKFLQGMHFVVGGTEAEARRKADELEDSLDIEALLAHVGGGFGVDLGGLPLDTPLGDLETEGSQGHLTAIRASVRGGNPTLRDIALYRSRANRVVGTPDQIADRLEQWQDAGIDGINIINQTIPGSYTDFIDGVLPELRSRGLAQTGYAPGTLREKLFGAGPRLNGRHPAAAFRGAFTEFSAAAENQPASVTAQS